MFFFIIAFVFNELDSLRVAILSVVFCYGIELFQLYDARWINEIRANKLGSLILGKGFLWSDMLCYTLGGITGFLFESYFLKKNV